MKARHIILTIAAIAMLAGPATVLAQQGPAPGDGSGPQRGGGQAWHGNEDPAHGLRFFDRMLPRLAEELELSDEQLTEIQGIVDAARPKIEEYAQALRNGRDIYRAANEDPTFFDEESFRAHAATQHQIQTELGVVAGQAKADALKVLTPEQLAQLEEMRGKFGQKNFRRGGGRRSSS